MAGQPLRSYADPSSPRRSRCSARRHPPVYQSRFLPTALRSENVNISSSRAGPDITFILITYAASRGVRASHYVLDHGDHGSLPEVTDVPYVRAAAYDSAVQDCRAPTSFRRGCRDIPPASADQPIIRITFIDAQGVLASHFFLGDKGYDSSPEVAALFYLLVVDGPYCQHRYPADYSGHFTTDVRPPARLAAYCA
jgi:hypothetical protein